MNIQISRNMVVSLGGNDGSFDVCLITYSPLLYLLRLLMVDNTSYQIMKDVVNYDRFNLGHGSFPAKKSFHLDRENFIEFI